MKSQNLFSEKNKKNISVCHLLKILPRVLSIKPIKYQIFQNSRFDFFFLFQNNISRGLTFDLQHMVTVFILSIGTP